MRGIEIIAQPRLSERTSMGLGGTALAELRVYDATAADALPQLIDLYGAPVKVLGAGSNIIAAEGQLPFVLLKVRSGGTAERLEGHGPETLVRVGAGLMLPVLLAQLAEMGCSGLEGLTGIPGSVGGAIAMNAGSYGQSMGDVLASVDVLRRATGEKRWEYVCVSREQIRLGYRHMSMPGPYDESIILSAVLRLGSDTPERIRAAMKNHMAAKRSSQPIAARSAGCAFKNPPGSLSAGRLLDEAGFKGKQRGGMAFSTMHANFLINEGHGSTSAALELLCEAEETVKQRFGVSLEREVIVWLS